MYSAAVCTCALITIQAIAVLARPQDSPGAQASQSSSTPIPIISQTEVVGPDGSFNYSYESGNGIKVEQSGYVKKAPADAAKTGELREGEEDDADIQVLQGSFSYVAPDGQQISLKYIADENGFQPEGDHLPTTPAVPAGISGALGQLQASPEQEASQSQPQPQAVAAAAPAPESPAAPEESSAAPSAESTPAA